MEQNVQRARWTINESRHTVTTLLSTGGPIAYCRYYDSVKLAGELVLKWQKHVTTKSITIAFSHSRLHIYIYMFKMLHFRLQSPITML